MSEPAVDPVLSRLSRLHPKRIDLSLGRMERLLAALGHPERQLPMTIHVAGTNGKGSTIAIMRAITEAAGYRAHVYSSPHLVRFCERIRLAGKLIEDAALIALLEECEAANGEAPITFFEITTAAAFLAFSRAPADILLLETGLGGRLDATNVIAQPLSTVISPVGFDHRDYLGDTLAAIAAEKAGIIKPGVPIIVAEQSQEAGDVIKATAAERRAPILAYGDDWRFEILRDRPWPEILYEDKHGLLALPPPTLAGEHQVANAALAVAALRHQRHLKIGEPAYRAGLRWATWPGRLQKLTSPDLLRALPAGSEIWVDGAHNAPGMNALARYFKAEGAGPEPVILLTAMTRNRDPEELLKPFAGVIDDVYCLPLPGETAGLPAAQLAASIADLGMRARMASGIEGALAMIPKTGIEGPVRVVIAGSLYLVGDALRLAEQLPA